MKLELSLWVFVPYSNQHALKVNSPDANLHKGVDTYLHPHLRVWGPTCQAEDSYPPGYHIWNGCPHWRTEKFIIFILIFLVPLLVTFLDIHLLSKLHREEAYTWENGVSVYNPWRRGFLPHPGCAAKRQCSTTSLSLSFPLSFSLQGLMRVKMNCITCLGNQLCS